MSYTNKFGQPIGKPMPDWKCCAEPSDVTLTGQTCRVERYKVSKHADDLYAAYSQSDGRDWTYLFDGPFETPEKYHVFAEFCEKSTDPRHYAIVDLATGKAVGTMSLMRVDKMNGAIEIGCISFSPLLMRSKMSTEAQYLLMAYVFDELGYRRYEWKCDSLNEPSRRAAPRLGFAFEGIFYDHMVIKGHSRDTAWYAITADRWPIQKAAFEAWLAPENFDKQGQQIKSLIELRKG